MALLDMQGMESEANRCGHGHGHGHGGGSEFSLALCASEASVILCL